jgi:hypothetical protein
MINVQSGDAVSYGSENSIEIRLTRQRSPTEVVCVENTNFNAYFIHWKVNYNQVFDIYGGGTTEGTRLIKYPKHGGANQRFRFIRNNEGNYQFVAANSGLAFGLWGTIPLATSVPRLGNPHQTFILAPV